ncbi:MAG: hypothetical protein K5840_05975 [Eubacterium sp.]|nr:hypothetical protein [Eubacterium sp.]
MNKTTKTVTEYSIDRDWMFVVAEGDKTTVYLHCNKSGTSKKVAEFDEAPANLDDEMGALKRKLEEFSDDIIYDTEMNPQHVVGKVSELWKDAKGENDFHNNVAYMVLGSMIKAYNEMYDSGNPWLPKNEELSVAIMKGVHKVGNMLSMVEHNVGGVNAQANNVGNLQ